MLRLEMTGQHNQQTPQVTAVMLLDRASKKERQADIKYVNGVKLWCKFVFFLLAKRTIRSTVPRRRSVLNVLEQYGLAVNERLFVKHVKIIVAPKQQRPDEESFNCAREAIKVERLGLTPEGAEILWFANDAEDLVELLEVVFCVLYFSRNVLCDATQIKDRCGNRAREARQNLRNTTRSMDPNFDRLQQFGWDKFDRLKHGATKNKKKVVTREIWDTNGWGMEVDGDNDDAPSSKLKGLRGKPRKVAATELETAAKKVRRSSRKNRGVKRCWPDPTIPVKPTKRRRTE